MEDKINEKITERLNEFDEDIKRMISRQGNLSGFKREKTTSERLGDITKKKLSKEMNLFSKKVRKKSVNVQSAREKQFVYGMFRNRKEAINGLTKKETLAEFLNKSLEELFRLTNEERQNEWKKFKRRCRTLREEGMIGIVNEQLSAGVVLKDIEGGHLGDRPLKIKQFVYFRCFDMRDATNFRKKMDKIVIGVDEASTQIINLSEEQIKNEKVVQVMNGGQKNENPTQ